MYKARKNNEKKVPTQNKKMRKPTYLALFSGRKDIEGLFFFDEFGRCVVLLLPVVLLCSLAYSLFQYSIRYNSQPSMISGLNTLGLNTNLTTIPGLLAYAGHQNQSIKASDHACGILTSLTLKPLIALFEL